MVVIISTTIAILTLALFLALRIPVLRLQDNHTHDENLNEIDRWLTDLNQRGKFNGTVLLAKNGNIVFENAYGSNAGPEPGPINLDSSFNLASVSKQFTAMGIVILEHRSLLDYDDKLSKFVPELGFYDGITIRNLLHHTSGIPDYMRLVIKNRSGDEPVTTPEIIHLYQRKRPALNFRPGEKFEYSNTGYVLLAEIIERVSGQKFSDFMAENIFVPLNMKNTRVFNLLSKNEFQNRVYGYSCKYWLFGGSKKPRDLNYFDGVAGDGGIYSSAHDLVIWHEALNEGTLVPVDVYKSAYRPANLLNGSSTKYGYGWFLNDDNTVEHAGGWQGFTSFIYRNLENRDLVVILDNSSNTLRVTSMGYRFHSIALNLKHAIRQL
jgi:CubicO group peptidase (beta-lactamase class C family)